MEAEAVIDQPERLERSVDRDVSLAALYRQEYAPMTKYGALLARLRSSQNPRRAREGPRGRVSIGTCNEQGSGGGDPYHAEVRLWRHLLRRGHRLSNAYATGRGSNGLPVQTTRTLPLGVVMTLPVPSLIPSPVSRKQTNSSMVAPVPSVPGRPSP